MEFHIRTHTDLGLVRSSAAYAIGASACSARSQTHSKLEPCQHLRNLSVLTFQMEGQHPQNLENVHMYASP